MRAARRSGFDAPPCHSDDTHERIKNDSRFKASAALTVHSFIGNVPAVSAVRSATPLLRYRLVGAQLPVSRRSDRHVHALGRKRPQTIGSVALDYGVDRKRKDHPGERRAHPAMFPAVTNPTPRRRAAAPRGTPLRPHEAPSSTGPSRPRLAARWSASRLEVAGAGVPGDCA